MKGFQIVKNCLLLLLALAAESNNVLAKPQKISESAWIDRDLSIPVLHLRGDIPTIMADHGRLVAATQHGSDTLEYFAGIITQVMKNRPLFDKFPALGDLLGWLNYKFVITPIIEHIPDEYEKGFLDFAKEAAIPEKIAWESLAVPDASLFYQSVFYSVENRPDFSQNFGCSSVIWNSGDETVLHGRNLDYSGIGYWDKHPLIVHIVPKEGLAHVALTTLGVHAPGLTAFNEAGLTLAIHLINTGQTSVFGTPIAVISAEVIRRAHNIDEAIGIIKSFSRSGGWVYVMSHGKDRAIVETTSDNVVVRRTSNSFAIQTNHASGQEIRKDELFHSPGVWIDTFERADRFHSIKNSFKNTAKNTATPQKMIEFLSDRNRTPPVGQSYPVIAGGTIARLDNIQSVVFNPTRKKIWISVGTQDLAPNENIYHEYRWTDLRSPLPPTLTGNTIKVEKQPEELRTLRKTLHHLMDQRASNRKELLEKRAMLTEELLSIYMSTPTNARGTWPAGYLTVWNRLKNTRESTDNQSEYRRLDLILTRALADGDLKLDHPFSRHRLAVGLLFKARLNDLMKNRAASIPLYKEALSLTMFERLKKAAEDGIRKPYTLALASSLMIDWVNIDLSRY